MKRVVLALVLAGSIATLLVHAQKTVRFDGKMDYALTVSSQSVSQVNAWWQPFQENNSLSGYCFDLNTLPRFKGVDEGIARRPKVILFNNTYSSEGTRTIPAQRFPRGFHVSL